MGRNNIVILQFLILSDVEPCMSGNKYRNFTVLSILSSQMNLNRHKVYYNNKTLPMNHRIVSPFLSRDWPDAAVDHHYVKLVWVFPAQTSRAT